MDSSLQSPAQDRLRGTLPRAWDTFDVYLFDVDGTLINCRDAVHYFAFCAALKRISGRDLNLDGVTAHGNTDVGILRDALNLAHVPEQHWRPHLDEICGFMCCHVADHRDQICAEVLSGSREILIHLRNRGAILGVATGNLKGIGTLKLASCGLLELFHFHAFSDGLECRTQVYDRALQNARSLAGPHATICAVGDTPADIRAARDHGMSIIAVATGIYSGQQLSAETPDLCLGSLAELLL